jgi:deazaflavin-dependent oxidoreductase (nitroreductase family)
MSRRTDGKPQAQPAFRSAGWRLGEAAITLLTRLGIGPMHLLTSRGRRTGEPRTTPVVPVAHDGRCWLVAPYGVVDWVRNVRADQHVVLRRGRHRVDAMVREVTPKEAAPVLKRYVAVATKVRDRFGATKDSPPEAFLDDARTHPVFELTTSGDLSCA